MSTSEIAKFALFISALSLVVAVGNLCWSIRSKFLHPRPRVKVHLRPAQLTSGPITTRYLQLEVVNNGPGDAQLERIAVTYRREGARFDEGMTLPSRWTGYDPASDSPFPVSVEPGRTFSAFLSDEPSILPRRVWRIGIVDGYGRRFWSPTPQMWRAIAGHRARHPDVWTREALAAASVKLPPVKW